MKFTALIGVTRKPHGSWIIGFASCSTWVRERKLSGHVEADKLRWARRGTWTRQEAVKITGTGGKDKTAVMGILERGGKDRTKVIDSRKKKALQGEVRHHVEAGSALYTDALKSYEGWMNSSIR